VIEQSCLVVMYHYVRDSSATAFPEIRALAPDLFTRQLDWLQERHTIVSVDDLQAALDGGPALPPRAALLTFDDGFIDHFTAVLPQFRARGMSGVFFIAHDACGPSLRVLGVHKTHFLLARLGAEALGRAVLQESVIAAGVAGRSGSVFGNDQWDVQDEHAVRHLLNYELPLDEAERVLDLLFTRHIGDDGAFARSLYLDESRIREMAAAGMTFGYHTRTHRMLSRLSVEQQREELTGGIEWVRALTGQSSVPFCYPWGGVKTYTADTVRALGELGYSLAFNTVRRRLRIGDDGRYELPRLDTRDLPPYTQGEEDAQAPAMAEEW
jgi:peptidoglycan/xylan/chitin deacetylase (PgdA/CDA1 family)